MLIYNHCSKKQPKRCMTSLSKMCMLTALVAAMLPSVAMGNDAHSSEILSLYGADSTKNNEMSVRYAGDYVTDSYYNRAIANYSLQQMNQALPQIVDPWAVQVIHEMSADMNAHAKRQDLLSVVIIKDNNINAFAVPGGLIGTIPNSQHRAGTQEVLSEIQKNSLLYIV